MHSTIHLPHIAPKYTVTQTHTCTKGLPKGGQAYTKSVVVPGVQYLTFKIDALQAAAENDNKWVDSPHSPKSLAPPSQAPISNY